MELRLVSCVLVTWNSRAYLARCLDGIREQTWAPVELIVVDNASGDGSADVCESAGARVIRNDSNRGFAAAVNQAIAVADGTFVLLVNPDCHLHEDYIARLVAAFDEAGENFGAATGMLLRARGVEIEPTGEIDSLGIRMTRSGRHFDLGQGVAHRPTGSSVPRFLGSSGVPGSSSSIRSSPVQEEGPLSRESEPEPGPSARTEEPRTRGTEKCTTSASPSAA